MAQRTLRLAAASAGRTFLVLSRLIPLLDTKKYQPVPLRPGGSPRDRTERTVGLPFELKTVFQHFRDDRFTPVLAPEFGAWRLAVNFRPFPAVHARPGLLAPYRHQYGRQMNP